jgi:hypothetical protein
VGFESWSDRVFCEVLVGKSEFNEIFEFVIASYKVRLNFDWEKSKSISSSYMLSLYGKRGMFVGDGEISEMAHRIGLNFCGRP